MPKLIDVIKRIFPKGTSPLSPEFWEDPPFWPPDAFAISATLVNQSGCYADQRYSTTGSPGYLFEAKILQEIIAGANQWARHPFPNDITPESVRNNWKRILQYRDKDLSDIELSKDQVFYDALIILMLVADEASGGIGFYDPDDPTPMSLFVYEENSEAYSALLAGTNRTSRMLGRLHDNTVPLTSSLTWMADPSEVVVQPKSRTPQVGCTLRSLSHHLSLLPTAREVKTQWLYGALTSTEEPLNLLLVPFPFQLDSNSFVPAGKLAGAAGRFFDIKQDWLRDETYALRPVDIAQFLVGLIKAAKKETRRVDGLVLPEAALSEEHVEEVARILSKQDDLQLFVSGISRPPSDSGKLPRNGVASFLFTNGAIYTQWYQSKHHRWKLDGGQIRRYHLGDALHYRDSWWEQIDISDRLCHFYVFRHGASMATLICEDLARVDPVQTVLRAIGPNLIVVLLMDGPQLERRWPGRYATVLADDPGSAVLTLTSMGMVRRSRMPGEKERREIALWKEPGGEAKELSLPDGCHGLLVTLSQSWETNYTLDGRSDNKSTMNLSLTGARGVCHPHPENWIDDHRRVW